MSDLYIDNFGLRFNTNLSALEYNSGAEVWLQVPVPSGDIGLTNGKILVGNGSNLATPVTISGNGTLSNTGVLSVTGTAAHAVIPASISSTITDNFTFPNNVTLNGNILKIGSGTFGSITSDSGQVLYIGTPSNTTIFQMGTNVQVNANMGIGGSAVASAALDIQATDKGLLPPRMTTTQRNAIASPAEALIVYDTTLHQLWEYQNGSWAAIGSGGATITSWTAYTPTIVGFGTSTNVDFFWKRIGDSVFIRGAFTTGTPTAVPGTITMPGGTAIDYTKMPIVTTGTGQLGLFWELASGNLLTGGDAAICFSDGSDTSHIYFGNQGSGTAAGFTKANGSSLSIANCECTIQLEVAST